MQRDIDDCVKLHRPSRMRVSMHKRARAATANAALLAAMCAQRRR
jgi:hypothetical protein